MFFGVIQISYLFSADFERLVQREDHSIGTRMAHDYGSNNREVRTPILGISVEMNVDDEGNVHQYLLPSMPVAGIVVVSSSNASHTMALSRLDDIKANSYAIIGLRIFSCLGLTTFVGFLTYLISQRV